MTLTDHSPIRVTSGGCRRLGKPAGGAESATPRSFRMRQLSTTAGGANNDQAGLPLVTGLALCTRPGRCTTHVVGSWFESRDTRPTDRPINSMHSPLMARPSGSPRRKRKWGASRPSRITEQPDLGPPHPNITPLPPTPIGSGPHPWATESECAEISHDNPAIVATTRATEGETPALWVSGLSQPRAGVGEIGQEGQSEE